MEIFGYVIGCYFYKIGSPSLSEEMKQKAIPVVRMEDVVSTQANVIKSVCLHEWDEGSHNVHKCTKCGKYNC